MKLLGSIYIAIAILVVTAAIGWYVDISHEQMHQRHLAVHTQLERMVRLRQELNGMLIGTSVFVCLFGKETTNSSKFLF